MTALAPSPPPLRGRAETFAALFDPPESAFRHDPAGWIEERLGERLWSTQAEIARSVEANRYTAVPSCHDAGKSFLAARLVCWWLDVHPVGEAFAVTTAPTQQQVDVVLWREIRDAHARGRLPGELTPRTAAWYMAGDQIVAFGRKPADYADAERAMTAFQGIHARYVLIVLDEASGIPQWLFDAADTLATNEHARVLAIGNPEDPASAFAKVCRPGSGWNTIAIDAFETPNFSGERVSESLRELLVSETWVEERRVRWGEGSPFWEAKVRGRFPHLGDDTLISPAMIRRGHETELPGLAKGTYGGDVARYGSDETVVYRNRGGQIRHVASASKQDTMESAGMFGAILRKHGPARVPMVVDVVGVGAGVFDRMRELGLPVYPFNGGESAFDGERFANRRAELYWTLREGLEREEIDLDPDDDELASQLQSVKWRTDSKGRILIESKEDARKRGIRSPDRADAAVQTLIAPPALARLADADTPARTLTGDLLTKEM